MGEDTFADPKEMTTDQLEGKLAYLETEASKLRKEKQARDVDAIFRPLKRPVHKTCSCRRNVVAVAYNHEMANDCSTRYYG